MKIPPSYLAFTSRFKGHVRAIVTTVVVDISSTVSKALGIHARQALEYNAIWDTGATGSVITPTVVDALSLKPIGKQGVAGVTGTKEADVYLIDLALPNKVIVQDVRVVALPLNAEGVDVLIGMDIILAGDMAISNSEGHTTFSFCIPPVGNPIDLVAKADHANQRAAKKKIRELKKLKNRK